MPLKGDFVPVGGREVFRVTGHADMDVDATSVSSEWTGPSDAEESPPEPAPSSSIPQNGFGDAKPKKKRKVRKWRLRHRVPNALRHSRARCRSADSSSSSTSTVSSDSSTSDGSSSDDGGVVKQQKREREQLMEQWRAGVRHPLPAAVSGMPVARDACMHGAAAGGCQLDWVDAGKKHRCFALARGFLSDADIKAIQTAAEHSTVREINDRKMNLAFKHRVWRFDLQLRALAPDVYERLMGVMAKADGDKWRRLRKNKHVYPEIEYIDYDVNEMGPCFIEPHVDNKSAVTLVAMLSDSSQYTGGRSCFRRAVGRHGKRELALERGDVVVFRGEKLTHWITPVLAGRRTILQIELSRV